MYEIPKDASYPLQTMMGMDCDSEKKTLEELEARIAERKSIEYKNFQELERMRKKLESTVNMFDCFYQPNQTMLATKSKLESEMIRIEMKKNDETVNAFRDVERLESEKRKILGDIREETDMNLFSGGFA
jgi:hypothetical protein